MTDIFLSYKREDQGTAKSLAEALEAKGWSVWWDPRLQAGEHFDNVIEKALQEARCVEREALYNTELEDPEAERLRRRAVAGDMDAAFELGSLQERAGSPERSLRGLRLAAQGAHQRPRRSQSPAEKDRAAEDLKSAIRALEGFHACERSKRA